MGDGILSAYLQVSGLSQSFGSGDQVHEAYTNVSFTLEKGEFLSITGPSGCGKTTLLRTIGGFLPPTAGTISIAGQDIKQPGTHCAMVFQTFDQLLPWKTVIGNVMYPLLVNKKFSNRHDTEAHAKKYLASVGLEKVSGYYPHQLSGGMKQRVAIARALAMEPSLILMDEPFASVDADTRVMLQKELKAIWYQSGITVLFVTHSIIEAISLSTRFMVMGKSEPSIRLFEPNTVQGEASALKTPESPGYPEWWSRLSHLIREGNDPPA